MIIRGGGGLETVVVPMGAHRVLGSFEVSILSKNSGSDADSKTRR